jgi:uncharacterized protein YwgA
MSLNRIQKAAILARLIERLREQRSWAGETHIQKAVYFLQDLLGCPLGFDFILYMYGPFSFDLRDELTGLRADFILKLEIQSPPYGPKFVPTEIGMAVVQRHPKTLAREETRIEFVAGLFREKGVRELERLATALYTSRELGWNASVQDRARLLHEVKPHVTPEEAVEAVTTLDGIRADVIRRQLDQTSN